MIQANKYRTTFRRLQAGMSVFHNDEILKIVKLKKQEFTEKGLIYHFDVEGGNGSLIGESRAKIYATKNC
ncbi:hypothetical protein [Candidatus Arsenophonus triatominarum]|uniref:hypothetical protein n=1 Tax=Candidatus Arsenophonus triatominarum TaxID=57911 RepID=UPI0007C49905|nr:hypothetical protein [Candidatus Arsenophonus triatominarum]